MLQYCQFHLSQVVPEVPDYDLCPSPDQEQDIPYQIACMSRFACIPGKRCPLGCQGLVLRKLICWFFRAPEVCIVRLGDGPIEPSSFFTSALSSFLPLVSICPSRSLASILCSLRLWALRPSASCGFSGPSRPKQNCSILRSTWVGHVRERSVLQ